MKKDLISVCICTYQRKLMLANLLKKLYMQETSDLFDFSVVVIDNDARGTAKEIVDEFKKESQINVIYEIESQRSIPAARNHAIRIAPGNFIAIIDDDEFPMQSWLLVLYKALLVFEVDGTLGPVYPFFEEKPPNWLIKGRFYERSSFRTGTLLDWNQTRTGNVLIKKSVFEEGNLKFDLRLKTSSSDRAFFKNAIKLGYKFVAVEEAPVYEIIPPQRWRKIYFIKRSMVQGYNTWQYLYHNSGILKRLLKLLRITLALITYLIIFPFCLILGPRWYVKILSKAAYHLSQIAAFFRIDLMKGRSY